VIERLGDRAWTGDRDRCRAAGIPEDAEFTTKPRLAQAMIGRALQAGVPFAWFTGDEVYGQANWLQAWLEDHGVSYVMAIRRSDTLTTAAGEQRADALIAAVPPNAARQREANGVDACKDRRRMGCIHHRATAALPSSKTTTTESSASSLSNTSALSVKAGQPQ
jgi:SRSO17 transposase